MRHPNFFLFTGENTYALKEEVRRWKRTFVQKHGEANLSVHASQEFSWGRFCDEAKAAPFLSEKRLLVLEGLPSITKEEFEELLPAMHEKTVLLLCEPILDKRKALTKFLLHTATVQVFPPLMKQKLVSWILSLGKEKEVAIHPRDAELLIDRVGEDQWCLHEECLKVIAFASPEPPTQKHIERVCLPSGTHAAWTLSDLIGKGKTEEAASYCRALTQSGEDASFLWNAVFLTIIKNLVTLWIFLREKNLPPASLARETGVHFLSVQSLLPFIQSLSDERIRAIVRSVLQADFALKTGTLRATASDPIELQTMLERQILGLGT